MKPERLEELRQLAGGVDAPKSLWMDELIWEVDRLLLQVQQLRELKAVLEAKVDALESDEKKLRAAVERLKDKYETCEQCDGSTDAGVFCVPCWNRVNLQKDEIGAALVRLSTAISDDVKSTGPFKVDLYNASKSFKEAIVHAITIIQANSLVEKPKCATCGGDGRIGKRISAVVTEQHDCPDCTEKRELPQQIVHCGSLVGRCNGCDNCGCECVACMAIKNF